MANKLQIKITLRGTKPPIWRRVLIEDDISFMDLHYIIQAAMGWYNAHLFEFDMRGLSIGMPFEDGFGDGPEQDANEVKVSTYLNKKGDKMPYVYDFGDSWDHLITVEKVEPLQKEDKLPICIKGKGNCPPEDCGGIWGYYSMLEAIKDKNHPEHEDMLEWIGDDFDPDAFDIDAINKRF